MKRLRSVALIVYRGLTEAWNRIVVADVWIVAAAGATLIYLGLRAL